MANPLTIIEHACECGATIKLHAGSTDDTIERTVYEVWFAAHAGHERVECWEATRIRDSVRNALARQGEPANA